LSDADHFKPKLFFSIFEKILSPEKKLSRQIFENFLKIGSLFVLSDADHFKPKLFFSIFEKLAN